MNTDDLRSKGFIEVPGKGWQKVPAVKPSGDAVQLNEAALPKREKDIHAEIIAWCNQQHPRWIVVHSRTDRPTTQQKGVCDLIVACPMGITLWCEVKRKNGKETPEQAGFRMELERLNHRTAVVHSLEEFWFVVNAPKGIYE